MASDIELYLVKMLGGDVEVPIPDTRIEKQLARLLGQDVECPPPLSDIERLLELLYESGFSQPGDPGTAELYNGDYTVTAQNKERILYTAGKLMRHNVTIKAVQEHRVSNTSGGQTIYIGNEV